MNKVDLVILAGGKGTRIKRLLTDKPKPKAKFNGKYFIEYIIQNYTPFQNYVYFTNKDNNKSIPEIFHSHIFVKS